MGALDVSMNAQGVAVERAHGRPVMSGFHAAFSAGGLVGAALGSLAAAHGVPVGAHLALAGALGLAVAFPLTGALLPASVDRVGGFALARPTRALAALGLLAFACLLCEGAAADWSAVYLRDAVGTGGGVAGLGYVAFSLAMFAGRTAGDRLVAVVGPVRTVRVLGATAATGLGAGLLAGDAAAGVAGFGALGLGLSCIVPIVFSAAGAAGGAAGLALAAVSTCGYLGFLVGPALVGGLSALAGLPAALGAVVLLAAVAVPLAPAAAPPRPAGAGR